VTRQILCLAALLPLGCSPAASNAGFETGPCIQDECYDGLQCLSSLCVEPDGDTDPGAGSAGLDGGNPQDDDDDDDVDPDDDDDDDVDPDGDDDDDDDDDDVDPDDDDDDDDQGDSTDDGETGLGPDDDDDDDDDDSSTGDPPPGDNPYENPDDGCPPGTINGLESVLNINACLPDCDPTAADVYDACPGAPGATAIGTCGTSSIEPGAACEEQFAACPTPGEFCVEAAFGDLQCAPGQWCVLTCFDGETCPQGMTCGLLGVCSWP